MRNSIFYLIAVACPVLILATPEGNQINPKLIYWIIVFGLIVVISELGLIKFARARWSPYSVIRLLGLTLIIISATALVIGFQEQTQITAVIGLLGTIAGYLLGKESKVGDDINPPSAVSAKNTPDSPGESVPPNSMQ